ncbi:MAG: thioredoxin family protein [Desulfobacterium sp.]|nr:thioredoxin family protein [Desulfobacterium sp.]
MNNFEEKLHAWNTRLEKETGITLVITGSDLDTPFIDFCDRLAAALPKVKVTQETDSEKPLPEIHLSNNLVYSALPLEQALDPFLEALSQVNVPPTGLPTGIEQKLAGIEIPTRLKLYVAQHCPHCPAMVRAMTPLTAACDQIILNVVDGTRFPEEASKDNVMSAPCLILDNDIRWTGSVDPVEVVDMIVNRDPSHLSAASLQMILEEGKANWIAARMMEANAIFPAFIKLLIHETWSVRLGAMVVVEEVAEEMPGLAARITTPLWEAFEGADTPVQGDILYALGESGDPGIATKIKALAPSLENPDLKEAATEALEAIESRS